MAFLTLTITGYILCITGAAVYPIDFDFIYLFTRNVDDSLKYVHNVCFDCLSKGILQKHQPCVSTTNGSYMFSFDGSPENILNDVHLVVENETLRFVSSTKTIYSIYGFERLNYVFTLLNVCKQRVEILNKFLAKLTKHLQTNTNVNGFLIKSLLTSLLSTLEGFETDICNIEITLQKLTLETESLKPICR